jgi:hypothetical protein
MAATVRVTGLVAVGAVISRAISAFLGVALADLATFFSSMLHSFNPTRFGRVPERGGSTSMVRMASRLRSSNVSELNKA